MEAGYYFNLGSEYGLVENIGPPFLINYKLYIKKSSKSTINFKIDSHLQLFSVLAFPSGARARIL